MGAFAPIVILIYILTRPTFGGISNIFFAFANSRNAFAYYPKYLQLFPKLLQLSEKLGEEITPTTHSVLSSMLKTSDFGTKDGA